MAFKEERPFNGSVLVMKAGWNVHGQRAFISGYQGWGWGWEGGVLPSCPASVGSQDHLDGHCVTQTWMELPLSNPERLLPCVEAAFHPSKQRQIYLTGIPAISGARTSVSLAMKLCSGPNIHIFAVPFLLSQALRVGLSIFERVKPPSIGSDLWSIEVSTD